MLEPVADDLLLTPIHRLDWHDASCDWSMTPDWLSPSLNTDSAREIRRGDGLDFEIVAPARRLDRLWLQLSTFQRSNTAHLWIEFREMSGRVLKRAYIDPSGVLDGALQDVLDLSQLALRPGAKYKVDISAPLGRQGDALGVWTAPGPIERNQLVRRLVRFRNDRSFIERRADVRSPLQDVVAVVVAKEPFCDRTGRLLRVLSRRFPEQAFEVAQADEPTRLWSVLAKADAVFFLDAVGPDAMAPNGFAALCVELYRRGVCTIFVDDVSLPNKIGSTKFSLSPSLARRQSDLLKVQQHCQYILNTDDLTLVSPEHTTLNTLATVRNGDEKNLLWTLLNHSRASHSPKFCIIAMLSATADIERFADTIVRQTYPGPIELVLVNDQCTQAVLECARVAALRLRFSGTKDRSITFVDSLEPPVEGAWQTGLRVANADLYTLIRCESAVGLDFVAVHVFEHARDDVDVVIGPGGFPSKNREDMTPGPEAAIAYELTLLNDTDLRLFNTENLSMKRAFTRIYNLIDRNGWRPFKSDVAFAGRRCRCILLSMDAAAKLVST